MTKPRVVIAGLGDSGVLTAIHLSGHADIVGISTRPGLLSGKELGTRLTQPEAWKRDYWTSFDRYRKLDGVRTVHATLTELDQANQLVRGITADGAQIQEPYDTLVISTGVRNGFWRRPDLLSVESVEAEINASHRTLAHAASVAVIGGGAAAVSSALNIARRWPTKRVDLYFPGERGLPHHHSRVWQRIQRDLTHLEVGLHPHHRAVIPADFDCDAITSGPVAFSTDQPAIEADAVLWTIGRVAPNTDWLPNDVLDDQGFVQVDRSLRVQGTEDVFAIGDVAATDPQRRSARDRADRLLARNIRASWSGGPMAEFRPKRRHWGSVVGVQPDGLRIFTPHGRSFRFPAWSIDRILNPWIIDRGIYRGIRR